MPKGKGFREAVLGARAGGFRVFGCGGWLSRVIGGAVAFEPWGIAALTEASWPENLSWISGTESLEGKPRKVQDRTCAKWHYTDRGLSTPGASLWWLFF